MGKPMTQKDAMVGVLEKAATDPVFRASLRENPRPALEAELTRLAGAEVHLAQGLEVVVLEDTAERMHLVLPPVLSKPDRDLSDAELDRLSGGGDTVFYCGGFTAVWPC